jgi:hypothetical protein
VNLTEKEQQLQSVNVELTALYGRVFDGPTECTSKSHSPPGSLRENPGPGCVCVFHGQHFHLSRLLSFIIIYSFSRRRSIRV